MNIKETITEEYIQFHYKKEGNHHFIEIRYNDEVEYRRVEIDGVNNIQVSKEERLKWFKKRDEVLEKIVRIRRLYEKMFGITKILNDIKDFQEGLDLEDSLDDRLHYLSDSIDIDDLQLAYDVYKVPHEVLKAFEEKMGSDEHLKG